MNTQNFKSNILFSFIAFAIFSSTNIAQARTIDFSGYTWDVKEATTTPAGPGGNYWGGTDQDVSVDASGLHLKVSQHLDDQKWYSSEVSLPTSLGYGKYTFDISSPADLLDKNLVAAPFLYQNDSHEIDIEHSFWANISSDKNLYYTVQPFDKPGNQQTQHFDSSQTNFQDIIYWEPNKITLGTEQNGNILSTWTYTSSTDGSSNNFIPGQEKVHINFWQYEGLIPLNASSTHEFIVNNFSFVPYVEPTIETNTTTNLTTSTTPFSHLTIRYNDNIILEKNIDLATTTYHDSINNIDYPLSNTSTVFSLLVNADQQNNNLEVSDAQFTAWANSFYVRCLKLTTNTSTQNGCDNWQYVVNSAYPNVGMDKYELTGGENVYIYFGDRYNLTTEKSNFNITETVTTTLKEYSYQTNDWTFPNNQLLIATYPILPDYSNWPPAQITSVTTTNGLGLFNFNTTGTYYITLPDSYWPGTTIIVSSTRTTVSTSQTTNTSIPTPSSGGSNSNIVTHNKIDLTKAVQFLSSHQNENGSFGAGPIYTDWAAVALSTQNDIGAKTKIKQYLLSNPDFNSGLNPVADLARHAIALMSLNINPYTGTKTNFIQKIVDSFDGSQFGNSNFYNDDIFALIPLLKAGYQSNDQMIVKDVEFIISKQKNDGSWDGVDLTSAAIQSLSPLTNIDGVSATLIKAKAYLKSAQKNDGGFGDAYATAWTIQSIKSLGEESDNWIINNKNSNDYLFVSQDEKDGGIDAPNIDSRIWATSYAIPAAMNKNWGDLLYSFTRPIEITNSEQNIINANTTSTTSTTIIIIPTTTTSTIEIKKTENKLNALPQKEAIKNDTNTIPTDNDIKILKYKTVTAIQELDDKNINRSIQSISSSVEKNQIIDNLPLDTPTKRTAKKVLAISGGSALLVAGYLGLRLLRNVV